jgi:hypothetical protein
VPRRYRRPDAALGTPLAPPAFFRPLDRVAGGFSLGPGAAKSSVIGAPTAVASLSRTVELVPADGTPPVAVGITSREQAQGLANDLNAERERASESPNSRRGLRVRLPAHKG